MVLLPVPYPGEDEPLGWCHLDVLATTADLLAVGAAHDDPQVPAHAPIRLGDRRLPVRPGTPPANQDVGARPGVEDHLP